MPAHEIRMKIEGGGLVLGSIDVQFDVRSNGELLGTLKLSRGGLDWRPRNHTHPYEVRWEEFVRMVEGRDQD